MSTLGGGVPQRAAAAAAAAAAGAQESRLSETFYRFQQREQRRSGETGIGSAITLAPPPCTCLPKQFT